MIARRALVLAISALLVSPVARSGHEQPVYPSYYPHEIEIAAIPPERAGELLRAGKLHAYVGGTPTLAPTAPADSIGAVHSLGAFVVVRLDPDSAFAKDETSACSLGAMVVRDVAERAGEVNLHPYPVTPFHGDYLNHADLADAARERLLAARPLLGSLRIRAASAATERLIRPEWLADRGPWDATVEEVSASRLVADATVALNGWLGPRWARFGWFQAHRLLANAIADPMLAQRIEARVERLQTAAYEGTVERINLEREVVRSLLSGCRAMVAGYTVKREYFNAQFSAGIENISFDALEGLSSPMFLRTVKLKDFPWNGWLQLGVEAPPDAAWNPVGGFTDPFGRLAWYAIGDAAAVPSPYEAVWMLNRITEVQASPRR